MAEEEIRAHWAWDKDMAWPTDEELKEFNLVRANEELVPPELVPATPKRAAGRS